MLFMKEIPLATTRLLLLLVALIAGELHAGQCESSRLAPVTAAELPHEALETLKRIKRGGPHPYRRDGSVFGNYERLLPNRPHGYYQEFTVKTPGAGNRGPRRIVAGTGNPTDIRRTGEYYYTDDHYRCFRKIIE